MPSDGEARKGQEQRSELGKQLRYPGTRVPPSVGHRWRESTRPGMWAESAPARRAGYGGVDRGGRQINSSGGTGGPWGLGVWTGVGWT